MEALKTIFSFLIFKDDFVIFHVRNTYDTVIESIFKTELVTTLSKKYKAATGQELPVHFSDKYGTISSADKKI